MQISFYLVDNFGNVEKIHDGNIYFVGRAILRVEIEFPVNWEGVELKIE